MTDESDHALETPPTREGSGADRGRNRIVIGKGTETAIETGIEIGAEIGTGPGAEEIEMSMGTVGARGAEVVTEIENPRVKSPPAGIYSIAHATQITGANGRTGTHDLDHP